VKRNSKKYRTVWEKANGPIPVDEKGRSYEIHHIDGNPNNNSLTNLLCLSIDQHYDIHLKQGDCEACHAIELRRSKTFLRGWEHSQKTRDKISNTKKGRKCSSESIEKRRKSRIGKKHSESTLEKISNAGSEPIKHSDSGVVYKSSLEAAKINGISQSAICHMIKKGIFKKITQKEYELKIESSNLKCYSKRKSGDSQKKRIIHVPSGTVYESVIEAAKAHNKHRNNMNKYVKSGLFQFI